MSTMTTEGLSFFERVYLDTLRVAVGESATHKKRLKLNKEVYIIVYALNDIVDDIIRKRTGEYFNHTAIAFDEDLKECYTFSMTTNGISKMPFTARPNGTDYMVYSLRMTDTEYTKLKENIKHIEKDKRFKYNWTELINIALKTKFEVESTSYYCTQFVYNMVKAAGAEVEEEFGEYISAQNFHKLIKNEKRLVFKYRKKIEGKSLKRVVGDMAEEVKSTVSSFAR